MHEMGVAQDLARRCVAEAHGRHVLEVWANCPVGLDGPELAECFAFVADQLGQDGERCLEEATLKLHPVPLRLKCSCGFEGDLDRDHVAGHVTICPCCAEVDEAGAEVQLAALICEETRPLDLS